MRGLYVLLFAFWTGSVFGQVEGDTLGLTGTVGDTVIANGLFAEMKGLIKKKQWQDAEQKGTLAKAIYEKIFGMETWQVADVLLQLGLIKYYEGNYDDAIKIHKNTLNIREKIVGEFHPKVASCYTMLGVSFEKKGVYIKAIEFKKKALDIQLKIYGPDHPDVSSACNNLGVAYRLLGDFETSQNLIENSIRIKIKTLPVDSLSLSKSYSNLAKTMEMMGDSDKSIFFERKALEIKVANLGFNHIDVASSFNNLGTSFYSKGAYNKAQEYFLKALDIDKSILDPEHPDIAAGYNNIGLFYLIMQDYSKAIWYLNLSLQLRLKANTDVSDAYFNIGYFYAKRANFDSAFVYYNKALEIDSAILGGNHLKNASTIKEIASINRLIGRFENSIFLYKKAQEIESKYLRKNHPDLISTFNEIGRTHLLNRKYIESINYFNKALVLNNYVDKYSVDSIQFIDELIISLYSISKAQNHLFNIDFDAYRLKISYHYAVQAIATINRLQNTFTEDQTKSSWQTKTYPIYEQAISVSLLKAEVDKNDTLRQNTFTYAEKSKASLLQAQIKAADAINFSGIPDSLLQREHDLRINITWREKQRQSLLDQGLTETDTNTLRISSIIFDLKRDYEALKQRFETDYPAYYRLKYDLNTVSLQYVQDTLLQPKNQALLEYFVGDSSIYLFVVRPDTLIVREIKRDFPLEDWIEQLRQGLYGYYTADKGKRTIPFYNSTQKKYLEYGQKLYQKLVAPVQSWLPEQVIVVPDGPLGYVPFDALLTSAPPQDSNDFKSYPYLLNKHQFSYTYSATLLKEMCDKKHHRTPTKEFAAFAPFYTGDTSLLANMYAYDDLMRKDLQPLTYSGPEVAAASKLMRGEIVAGPAATEERFTSTAGDYRILHLATHGRADNRVGDYAFLAFTEIKDSIENELLYVKDLYNLELNADLVVLSACETGIGKLQRGEGIISLARAFAYAGAKSIVTTLWEVNDKSTSELMRYFYRELRKGKTKDESLRSARKAYLEKSKARTCHPFFWAAFVPVGDMRAVK